MTEGSGLDEGSRKPLSPSVAEVVIPAAPPPLSMAQASLNPALKELRGSLDGLTFRRRADGEASVFVQSPASTPPSDAQLARRRAFGSAQRYARQVLADPLQRGVYQALAKTLGRPTNTLLVGNFLNPPVIETVVLAGYTGAAGEEIAVLASDAIAVESVAIEVRGTWDAILEAGPARCLHGVWRYRTTADVPTGTPWRVVITVQNRAGHAAILSLPDPRDPAAAPTQASTRPPAE